MAKAKDWQDAVEAALEAAYEDGAKDERESHEREKPELLLWIGDDGEPKIEVYVGDGDDPKQTFDLLTVLAAEADIAVTNNDLPWAKQMLDILQKATAALRVAVSELEKR